MSNDLQRIKDTLILVAQEIACTDLTCLEVTRSEGGDPTTKLDRRINQVIHQTLPQSDEGWLSEETRDDPVRLACRRLWVVDPIDGTREFVEGIPEWAVSIGLVMDGQAVAGGVLNPCTGELFLGATNAGVDLVRLDDREAAASGHRSCLLVSRREHRENKWRSFEEQGLPIRPVGSIAYRLARVAAGMDLATCTFEPRSEWDVAGGVALMNASGGRVETASGEAIRFNKEVPKLTSFFAFAKDCPPEIPRLLRNTGRP
ncbi:MAG TPA: inositol monophosphatase family protein [Terracidiphilus sp.]